MPVDLTCINAQDRGGARNELSYSWRNTVARGILARGKRMADRQFVSSIVFNRRESNDQRIGSTKFAKSFSLGHPGDMVFPYPASIRKEGTTRRDPQVSGRSCAEEDRPSKSDREARLPEDVVAASRSWA